MMVDIAAHNRDAWDSQVEQGNRWTVPVSSEEIAAAREGRWDVLLTESKPVPRDWFPADLRGVNILCLASGGGNRGRSWRPWARPLPYLIILPAS